MMDALLLSIECLLSLSIYTIACLRIVSHLFRSRVTDEEDEEMNQVLTSDCVAGYVRTVTKSEPVRGQRQTSR